MNKYNAKKTVYNGELYDSKAEASFAAKLDIARKAEAAIDRVESIERQCVYAIEVNGKHIAKYIADFRVTYANGEVKVYDVKGVATPVYRLKKKLVEAIHGITIIEVKK
jgi:uncharacterized protein YegP (UPF0339 family)